MFKSALLISIFLCLSIQVRGFSQEQLIASMGYVLESRELYEEFGMLDEQKRELRKLYTEFRTRVAELGKTATVKYKTRLSEGAEPEELREILSSSRIQLAKDTEALNKEFEKEIGRILVPRQIKKIKQINFVIRQGGYGMPFLLFEKAYSELGMNPTEEKEAKAKLAELKKKYTSDYNKLNQTFLNDMMKSLGPERAAKLKDLIGEEKFFPPIR